MKKYTTYLKKYKHLFILGPIFVAFEASGEVILPYLTAGIINVGAANHDIPYIIKNGIWMAAIAIAMLVAAMIGSVFSVRGSVNLSADLRRDVFRRIQKFSFANIDDFSTGSLITRITNDITQIQNFIMTLMRSMLRTPIMLIGATVMAFVLNPKLAFIILAAAILLSLGIAVIIKAASPRFSVMQAKLDGLNSDVRETVTNERVIKSFVREAFEKDKFYSVNNALMDKSISALKIMILQSPASTIAIDIATIAVVWFAGKQIMAGSMELGTLTAFVTYLSQILSSLDRLANIFLQGTRAVASDKRITQVMDEKIDITDEEAGYPDMEVTQGEIEFRSVSFRYYKDNQEKVLENISLHINPGELVGIIGSTGSGKSTLVSLIPRLYDTDEGSVRIDGIDVRDLSLYNLRESVSVVLQGNMLFSGSIAENLRWGSENGTDEEIAEAAAIAQADEFIRSFSDGYETELGQGGVNLSGGQKQRICIARALLKRPKILILDDSTSAVDTATEAKIRESFRTELKETTKIIIAQRITSVIDADKIIVLDSGKIVGCGTHTDLLASCTPYQEIYYSQKDRDDRQWKKREQNGLLKNTAEWKPQLQKSR